MEKEQSNFWLTFVTSTVGGIILAIATIPPATAVANVNGWIQLITGLRVPLDLQNLVAWISLLFGILGLVGAMLSLNDAARARRFGNKIRAARVEESFYDASHSD